MSKYIEWYSKQDEEFKKEINPHSVKTNRFIDYRLQPISMNELASLDSKYCLTSDDITIVTDK